MKTNALKYNRFSTRLALLSAASALALAVSALPAIAGENVDSAGPSQPEAQLDLFKFLGLEGNGAADKAQAADDAKGDATDQPKQQSATAEADPQLVAPDDDPLESLNRFTFRFNQVVRGAILDPLISGYKAVTPEPVQKAVSNVASNLTEPVTIVSSLLEGDSENAANSTQRFLVNSTVGMGGMSDPAADMGMQQRREDLGQAMAVNGVGHGTYIVLPIIGPSTTRDAAGDLATSLASPMPLVGSVAAGAVQYSDNQEAIKAATANSLDAYETEKALYLQHRQYLVNNGKDVGPDDGPSLADDEAPSVAEKASPTAK